MSLNLSLCDIAEDCREHPYLAGKTPKRSFLGSGPASCSVRVCLAFREVRRRGRAGIGPESYGVSKTTKVFMTAVRKGEEEGEGEKESVLQGEELGEKSLLEKTPWILSSTS